MKERKNINGQRFGKMVVLREVDEIKGRPRKFECLCDCGVSFIALYSNISAGKQTHCKNCKNESKGATNNNLRAIWYLNKERNTNPANKHYKNYGKTGISWPDEWKDFNKFCEDIPGYTKGLTLQRHDITKGHSKDNSYWGNPTYPNQVRKFLTVKGETLSISQWAKKSGLSLQVIANRLKKGWNPEHAVSFPILKYPYN